MGELVARVKDSHALRSWTRYGEARGALLAGGVAYLAFFSVIPSVLLGLAVLGLLVGSDPALMDTVTEQVNGYLPGLLKSTPDGEGLLDPRSDLPGQGALTVATAVSVATMLVSGLGWVDALREAVRAMFGQPVEKGSFVALKARDLGVLVTMGLALLLTTGLSQLVTATAGTVVGWVGLDGSVMARVLLSILGIGVVLLADLGLMIVILRLLSGVDVPRERLRQGALVGAVGLGVLKLASGVLLSGAANKPYLAAFAVVLGLLVWLNFVSRVVLLAAAWAATTVEDSGVVLGPPRAQYDRPAGPREDVVPSFGERAADRTTLAAGAVLGVSAALAGRTLVRAGRAAADAVRRP